MYFQILIHYLYSIDILRRLLYVFESLVEVNQAIKFQNFQVAMITTLKQQPHFICLYYIGVFFFTILKGLSHLKKFRGVNVCTRWLKHMTFLGTQGFCKSCLECWYLWLGIKIMFMLFFCNFSLSSTICSKTFFHKCDIYNLIYVFIHV